MPSSARVANAITTHAKGIDNLRLRELEPLQSAWDFVYINKTGLLFCTHIYSQCSKLLNVSKVILEAAPLLSDPDRPAMHAFTREHKQYFLPYPTLVHERPLGHNGAKAGVGGDEASLLVSDLLCMSIVYGRAGETNGWKFPRKKPKAGEARKTPS